MAKDRIIAERRSYNNMVIDVLDRNGNEVASFTISVDTRNEEMTQVKILPHTEDPAKVLITYSH